MTDNHDDDANLAVGLASGLAAGLLGAWVMTGFQSLLARVRITSGVSGVPSTEKAADRLSMMTRGRALSIARRPAAGEAVHYGLGSLVGGLYGMAAEREPRVTVGRGAAFGAVAATLVDEALVPAFGLGDPVWKAPAISHPYSYASHLVFGTATETARFMFRLFFGKVKAGSAVIASRAPRAPLQTAGPARWETLSLAFLLGATAGPRTSAPLVAVSWAARLGWIDLTGSRLAFLGTMRAVCVTTPLALGELVVDKLPSTPDRTMAGGVVARAASGALAGAALVGGRSVSAALAGAAGSIAATYLGQATRKRLSRAIGTDWPVAVAEDVLAFGGAVLVCVAALAPARRIAAAQPTVVVPAAPRLRLRSQPHSQPHTQSNVAV